MITDSLLDYLATGTDEVRAAIALLLRALLRRGWWVVDGGGAATFQNFLMFITNQVCGIGGKRGVLDAD